MKIFHLTFSFTTGGAETLMVDLIKEQSLAADVSLIIINDHVNYEMLNTLPRNISLILLKRNKGSKWNISFLLKLWTIIFIRKPQVLHCHNDNLIPLLPFFRSKTILTLHNVGIPVTFLARYKMNIAISNAVIQELNTRYKGKNTKVVINGIDFSLVKRKMNYSLQPAQEIRLLQIGRLTHDIKGQDVMLKALSLLNTASGVTYSVTFIGDGPSLKYLKQLSKDLNIEQYVHFAGYKTRDYIFDQLHTYDLLVQPSRTEGFGLTIVEAIAAGVPVAASNIEGPMEILKEFSDAWIFQADNAEALKETIENVAGQYLQNRVELSAAKNRNIAEDLFSIKNTAAQYMSAYEHLNDKV